MVAPAESVPGTESQTIFDLGKANPDFSTLMSLIDLAGLAETLQGPGPFTVAGK